MRVGARALLGGIMGLSTAVGCGGAGPTVAAADVGHNPLAVTSWANGDLALNSGTLLIDQPCVWLAGPGQELTTLVWDDRATWDPEDQSILYRNHDGAEFRLRHGQEVWFGGGGDSETEGGRSAAEWLASVDWVRPPDPTCVADTRFFVNDVLDDPPR